MEPTLATVEDIRYAYRLLLGREPDVGGLEHFRNLLEKRPLVAAELGRIFLDSAEFTSQDKSAPVEVMLEAGYSIFVRPSDHDIGQHIRETHEYEPHVTTAVRDLLHAGGVFVDVGANIGYFTALAAHRVGAAGLVLAIEPMDKNLQLIYRSLERNGFNNVRVHACAASDRMETVCVATGSGTSNGQVLRSSELSRSSIWAQTRRLDDLVADVRRIDLVKMDIEGFELLAWRGFRRSLAQHRPIVLSEFHPHCMRTHVGVDPMEYLGELFEYASEVQVLHYNGGSISCPDSGEVMRQWERADKSVRGDGTHHLDLLIKPKQ
jgi:FkbM family methyltransferase